MSEIHKINAANITKVRRNDSTVTSLCTHFTFLFTDQVAHSLGRALARNNHVTSLSLDIDRLTSTGNYPSLLGAIENSTTIEKIELHGHSLERGVVHMGTVADRFLNAISSNSTIQKVSLEGISGLGTNPFLALIRSSITTLKMDSCYFADSSEQASIEIAAGFRANQSLQRLEMMHFTVAVFDALENHPSLRHLSIQLINSSVGRDALGHVLSSCPIEHLELHGSNFSGAMFETLAQGMRHNHTLTTLQLWSCNFDENSTESFIRLLENDDSLLNLMFMNGTRFSLSQGRVMRRVLRSNTTLKNLSMNRYDDDDAASILEALETNTTLKTLDLVGYVGHQSLGYLSRSLPKLSGLTKLILLVGANARAYPAETFLLAFQRNRSLQEVVIRQIRGNEYLGTDALAMIHSFCQRNKELPLLLAAPVGVGSHSSSAAMDPNDEASINNNEAFRVPEVNLRLRPRAYSVAQRMHYGTDTIFRDLLLLGGVVGTSGSRKRRRRTSS